MSMSSSHKKYVIYALGSRVFLPSFPFYKQVLNCEIFFFVSFIQVMVYYSVKSRKKHLSMSKGSLIAIFGLVYCGVGATYGKVIFKPEFERNGFH